jgi:type I restriction enzyme, S subunit
MLPGGELPASYLLFWTKLNMDAIKQKANGSTFMEVSKSAFRPIPLVVPAQPLVRAFDGICKPLLDRIAENERQRRLLAQVRDTILPRLMSGKIRLPGVISVIEEAAA